MKKETDRTIRKEGTSLLSSLGTRVLRRRTLQTSVPGNVHRDSIDFRSMFRDGKL